MKILPFFLAGSLFLHHIIVSAQTDTVASGAQKSIPKSEKTLCVVPDKAYFKSWLTDARDIVTAPVRWNPYQWLAFSGIAFGTVVLFTQDAVIQQTVQSNRNSWMNDVSTYALEPWGSGLYTLPALGIMYGVGAIVKDDKARYTALKGFEAYVFGFVTAQIIKQLTHRHRPYEDNPPNPYVWDGPFMPISNSSFPSGHSTVVFAVATVIATSYSKTIWVPILCYSLAGLTAASRVYQNEHWFSDVFVGSVLGFAIGRTIMNNHIKKLKILPVSPTGVGVTLLFRL